MSTPRALILAMLASGGFTVVIALALWQSSALVDHAEACARVRNEQERQVEKARAAKKDWDLLQAEIADFDGKIARLAAVVPARPAVEDIVDRVTAWCAERGLEPCGASHEVSNRELYDEVEITLALCGPDDLDPGRLPETWSLADWVGPRAAVLRAVDPHPDGLEVRLVVYAMEGFQGATREDWCDQARWPEVSSRLWLFASRAREARDRLGQLCLELAENRGFVDAVEDLEARRWYLAFTTEVVRTLVEKGGARTSEPLVGLD